MDNSEVSKKQKVFKQQSNSSLFEFQSQSESGISHQNSECVKREKNERLRRKKRRIYSTKSKGNWENDEQTRFMTFMIENKESFVNRDLRRSNKIFKKMAKYVKTRCPQQCRSHHQKYEKKFLTFENIVGSIQIKIRLQQQKVKIQACKQELKMQQRLKKKILVRRGRSANKNRQNEQTIKLEYEDDQKSKKEKLAGKTRPPNEYRVLVQEQSYKILELTGEHQLEFKVLINLQNIIQYQW